MTLHCAVMYSNGASIWLRCDIHCCILLISISLLIVITLVNIQINFRVTQIRGAERNILMRSITYVSVSAFLCVFSRTFAYEESMAVVQFHAVLYLSLLCNYPQCNPVCLHITHRYKSIVNVSLYC